MIQRPSLISKLIIRIIILAVLIIIGYIIIRSL